MNNQIKVVMLWLMIVIGIVLHSVLETAEALYYSPLPEEPYGEGTPVEGHIIAIAAMIVPMLFGFLSLFLRSKTFIWIALIYASLLGLLNIFHAVADGSLENITQLVLLSSVAVINVLLVITLNNWRKEHLQSED
ncbi:MAG: hypothetical protein AAGB24_04730 [Bacteroidota bacterium]